MTTKKILTEWLEIYQKEHKNCNLKNYNGYLFHGTLDTSFSGVWGNGKEPPKKNKPRGA